MHFYGNSFVTLYVFSIKICLKKEISLITAKPFLPSPFLSGLIAVMFCVAYVLYVLLVNSPVVSDIHFSLQTWWYMPDTYGHNTASRPNYNHL